MFVLIFIFMRKYHIARSSTNEPVQFIFNSVRSGKKYSGE